MPNKRTDAVFRRRSHDSEKGYALVSAIIACVILLGLAMLVIQVSTQDLRISAQTVGEKKAMAATDSGIHRLVRNFNPNTPPNYNVITTSPVAVDAVNAPGDSYQVTAPATAVPGPPDLPLAGYSFPWGQKRYNFDVTGTNSAYGSRMEIGMAVGYGPVKTSGDYE
jgi:hypothetical protein